MKSKSNYERETILNNYINKFPKVKLETIIKINKIYNNKLKCSIVQSPDIFEDMHKKEIKKTV